MYQWAPPGGRESGARGVSPTSRRSGSSASSRGRRSNSSVPRPCSRISAPSGVPSAGRNWWGQDSRFGLTPGPVRPMSDATHYLGAEATGHRDVAPVPPELVPAAVPVPHDVGRLVLERVVADDPVLRRGAAAERLRGGDDDAAGEGSGLR